MNDINKINQVYDQKAHKLIDQWIISHDQLRGLKAMINHEKITDHRDKSSHD